MAYRIWAEPDGRCSGGLSMGALRNRYCTWTDDRGLLACSSTHSGDRRVLLSAHGENIRGCSVNLLRKPTEASSNLCFIHVPYISIMFLEKSTQSTFLYLG